MLGTANSLAVWTSNVILLFLPTVIGYVYDRVGYLTTVLIFSILAGIMLVVTLILKCVVHKKKAFTIDQRREKRIAPE